MKNIFKKIALYLMIVLSFVFISACGKDNDDKGNDNIVPTFESFEIVGENNESLIFNGNNDSVSTLSSNSEENPFGEGKKTIEEKINEEIDVGEQITIDYTADVNEYIYAITKIKNPSNKVISSITISGQRYTSNLFEDDSTKEKIVIKLFVGNISSIKNYTLESIKYIDDSSSKDITITGNTSKIVKVGTIDAVSYILDNVSMTNTSVSFGLRITDNDGIILATKGKATAVLYDGESLIKTVELSVGAQNVTFDNIETNKIYQYGIVATYDKLDGNGKKNYLLTKHIVSIKNYQINMQNTENGSVAVSKNIAYAGETITITSTADEGYKLTKTYYMEKGSTEKNYFENNFIMPRNDVTLYGVFEKVYKITTIVTGENKGIVNVDEMVFSGDTIEVFAEEGTSKNYTISEMYYIEENSDIKNYFGDKFIMPNKNVTLYVVYGTTIYIHNKEELIARLQKHKSNWDNDIELCADIDLDGIEWMPIGDSKQNFTGNFEGNGHIISNYKISQHRNYNGFFGITFQATIKNLKVHNFSIKYDDSTVTVSNTAHSIGGLVASTLHQTVIDNCQTVGTINVTTKYGGDVGGLVGSAGSADLIQNFTIDIKNNFSNVEINVINTSTTSIWVGGLIADLVTKSTIQNNSSIGNIVVDARQNKSFIGGLIGETSDASIIDSYSTSDVVVLSNYSESYVGGLIGNLTSDAILNKSYASGDVSINAKNVNSWIYAGGLVGENAATINNSYAKGNVTAINENKATTAGGLVGINNRGIITNSYAVGDVISTSKNSNAFAGGLVGKMFNGSISNSYAVGNCQAKRTNNTSYYFASGGLIGEYMEGTLNENYKYENQIIKLGDYIVEGTTKGTSASMQTIWQFVYNNWDNTIWNLSLTGNPTLK